MKWWANFGLALGLLAGSGGYAYGQAAGSRAQVSAVATSREAARFQVPQVKLPNAAAARRINRQLLRYVTSQSDQPVDSTASPRQQLYQMARECCYDAQERQWYAAGEGLTGTAYTILPNQDFLLSIEFQDDYFGREELETHHLTFDLRTGRQLSLADLVADSPAELGRRFDAAISRRLRAELANVAATEDSVTVEYVAQLYGLSNWRGARGDAAFAQNPTVQPIENGGWYSSAEFAVTPRAVLLFHAIGMSRANIPFLPDEKYTFPFERIRLQPAWQHLKKSRPHH